MSAFTTRAAQTLPLMFGAALAAGMAVQAMLPGPRPMRLEIPVTIDAPPGAAPQQSVAPEAPAAPVVVQQMALPTESVPTPEFAGQREPASAPGDDWSTRLPPETANGGGAGNIVAPRTRPQTPVAALVDNILKSLKRMHSMGSRPAALRKAKPPATRPATGWTPPLGALNHALGGPAPPRPILGGPTPAAVRYAPAIGGVPEGRR